MWSNPHGLSIGYRPGPRWLCLAITRALYLPEPDPLDLYAYYVSWEASCPQL